MFSDVSVNQSSQSRIDSNLCEDTAQSSITNNLDHPGPRHVHTNKRQGSCKLLNVASAYDGKDVYPKNISEKESTCIRSTNLKNNR